jgi:hypothetical protein
MGAIDNMQDAIQLYKSELAAKDIPTEALESSDRKDEPTRVRESNDEPISGFQDYEPVNKG